MHTGDPQPLEPVPGVQSLRYLSLQGPGEKSVTVVPHLSSPVQIYGHTAAGNHPALPKHKRETRGHQKQTNKTKRKQKQKTNQTNKPTQKKPPKKHLAKGRNFKFTQYTMQNYEINLQCD